MVAAPSTGVVVPSLVIVTSLVLVLVTGPSFSTHVGFRRIFVIMAGGSRIVGIDDDVVTTSAHTMSG